MNARSHWNCRAVCSATGPDRAQRAPAQHAADDQSPWFGPGQLVDHRQARRHHGDLAAPERPGDLLAVVPVSRATDVPSSTRLAGTYRAIAAFAA